MSCARAVHLAFAVLLASPTSAQCDEGEFIVGAAAVDITPKVGEPHHRGDSRGAHDPLHVRAIVFRQGSMQAAVAICDVGGVSVELTGPTRKRAEEVSGIVARNIVITATHTHTGPRGHNDLTPGDESGYAVRVQDSIVHAIKTAQQNGKPAKLQAAMRYQQPTVSFNRRFRMKDGGVRMNPGVLNENIVAPEGPIDPELRLLMARDKVSGQPIASLTNFALHLDTVGGQEYSADYPLYIHQFLQGKFGEGFVSLFGTGCCGDINHLDVSRSGPQRGHVDDYQSTKHIGEALSSTVNSMLTDLTDAGAAALAVYSKVVRAPLQTYTEAEIAWARGNSGEPLVDERPFLQGMRRRKLLSLERLRDQYGDTIPLEVQVVRLTDKLALVFLPGEIFVELGKAIKAASPFEHTMVIELANASPAYVPTRLGFANGDYEAVNSRVQSGGGELLVQAAVRLLFDAAADSLANETR